MTTAEIIQIGQELIAKVGTFEETDENSHNDLSEYLKKVEEKLQWNNSKHGQKIQSFIDDLQWDIRDWRKIKIDGIQSDEQVRTFFETERQIEIYNNLIDVERYKTIFHEINKDNCDYKCVHDEMIKLEKKFMVEFEKLSSKIIAKNMLIFSLFERNLPLPALMRLSKFLKASEKLEKDSEIVESLQKKYRNFTAMVYKECTQFYKNGTYNYKFLRIWRDKSWKIIKISFYEEDASYENLRSWNHKFEYREILRKLKP